VLREAEDVSTGSTMSHDLVRPEKSASSSCSAVLISTRQAANVWTVPAAS
jgi:hypothetical protein